MGIILVIVGAILYWAGPWFDSQETVGLILLIAGVALTLLQIILFAIGASKVKKAHRDFDKRWSNF